MNFAIINIIHFLTGVGGSCNDLSDYLASYVSCNVSLLAFKKLVIALWCGSVLGLVLAISISFSLYVFFVISIYVQVLLQASS